MGIEPKLAAYRMRLDGLSGDASLSEEFLVHSRAALFLLNTSGSILEAFGNSSNFPIMHSKGKRFDSFFLSKYHSEINRAIEETAATGTARYNINAEFEPLFAQECFRVLINFYKESDDSIFAYARPVHPLSLSQFALPIAAYTLFVLPDGGIVFISDAWRDLLGHARFVHIDDFLAFIPNASERIAFKAGLFRKELFYGVRVTFKRNDDAFALALYTIPFQYERTETTLILAMPVPDSESSHGDIFFNARMTQTLFDASNRGVALIDERGNALITNRKGVAGTEFARERPTIFDGKPLTAQKRIAALMATALREHCAQTGVFEYGRHHYAATFAPIADALGRARRLIYLENELFNERSRAHSVKIAEANLNRQYQEAPIGLFRISLKGRLTFANRRCARALGYASPEEAVLALQCISTQLFQSVKEAKRIFTACIERAPRKTKTTVALRAKDGSFKRMTIVARMATDIEGAPWYFEATMAEAERAKRRSKKKSAAASSYRFLVDNARTIIIRITPEGVVKYANPFALKFFGYTAHELVGAFLYDAIFPLSEENRERTNDQFRKFFIDPKQHGSFEAAHRKKSGEEIIVSWATQTFFRKDNTPKETICFGNDVTELRDAERILRETHERSMLNELNLLSTIIANVENGIAIVNEQGRIVYWNKGCVNAFHYSEREAIRQNAEALLPKQLLTMAFSGKRVDFPSAGGSVHAIKRKDGSIAHCLTLLAPYKDPAGKCFVFIFVDITKEMLIRERYFRIRKKRRRLSRLFILMQETQRQNIAREVHDNFAQMLGVLKMNLHAMLQSKTPSKNALAGSISLVETLLDSARDIANDLSPWAIEHFGLVHALSDHVASIPFRVTFECASETDAIETRLSSAQKINLFRIAQEAIHNAIRHSHGDAITVTLAAEPEAITLTIRDNGRGMPQKSDNGPPRKGGLGIFNMHERARIAKGKLTVKTRKGKGAEICVTVPQPFWTGGSSR